MQLFRAQLRRIDRSPRVTSGRTLARVRFRRRKTTGVYPTRCPVPFDARQLSYIVNQLHITHDIRALRYTRGINFWCFGRFVNGM